MTTRTRNTGFGTRVRNFATFVDGIVACAAAAEAGRKPSRRALIDAGFEPNSFDSMGR